ncbi:class-II fumarase/aspartase family protein [Streptomyces antimicrobicus]|uniref:Adenylosuccinate lyase family protein n=1 Tax=Streptomyces antimicrobicus TaxID=2883108 RepID=A0ABS8B7H4_9ACTN|nr:adenylosuccinate lyase family protein [Streptomyces antimicrobicus]MCB5180570.1 adenylosuccinate lyase family protein [Streptomyces antimicrobicus]
MTAPLPLAEVPRLLAHAPAPASAAPAGWSGAQPQAWEGTDAGLLSPVRAGTPAEAATSDTAWLQAMLDAEAALARAQARLGTLPARAAQVITEAADARRLDVRGLALAARETANPVVGLVAAFTRVVAEADPAAAEYVHRGSTSQDVLDTGTMLVAARTLKLLRADLLRTADALAALAAEHRDTVVAGRTLALHAVPTTFGLKAAGWRHLLLDAIQRIDRLRLPVSIGGAAGTLAGYLEYARLDGPGRAAGGAGADDYADQLAAAFACETGLCAPALPWHALRTPVADLGAVLAHTAGALGKFAVDVLALARTETAEVAEPGPAGRGASSAMPHKRNPVLATLIRSAALVVPALAGTLAQALVSEDERSAGVWHSEWHTLRECLRLTGGAAHTAVELAAGLTVDPDRMRANLGLTGSLLVTERIAAVLAPRIGKATARQLLTEASATAHGTGTPLLDVLAADPRLGGVIGPEELRDLLEPAHYTGAAGPLTDRALKRGASTS